MTIWLILSLIFNALLLIIILIRAFNPFLLLSDIGFKIIIFDDSKKQLDVARALQKTLSRGRRLDWTIHDKIATRYVLHDGTECLKLKQYPRITLYKPFYGGQNFIVWNPHKKALELQRHLQDAGYKTQIHYPFEAFKNSVVVLESSAFPHYTLVFRKWALFMKGSLSKPHRWF